ncbi:MAG: hypothetical protein R6V85_13830 [Polyangia bacterium]
MSDLRWTVLVLALGIAARVVAARAGETADEEVIALLAQRDAGDPSRELARAVEVQLSDLPVRLEVVWIDALPASLAEQQLAAESCAAEHGALAVIWLDLLRPERLFFFLAAEGGERILARRLAGDQGATETAAVIARASVAALLEGGRVEVAPPAAPDEQEEEPPPPEPRDEPEAEPPPTGEESGSDLPRLGLEVAYSLELPASRPPATHGAELGLAARLRGPLSAFVRYRLAAPLEARSDGIELVQRRYPVSAGARLELPAGPLRIGAELGLTLAWVAERIRALSEQMDPGRPQSWLAFSLVPAARLAVPVFSAFELYAAVGVAVPLNPVRYTVDDGGGRSALFAPWPVRPLAAIGVAARLL